MDSRFFYMLLELTNGGELFHHLEETPEGRFSNSAGAYPRPLFCST